MRGEITGEHPWLAIVPAEHRPTLRAFAASLLDLAVCERLGRDRHAAHVRAAACLGEELRSADRPLEELFTELHVMRAAIWRWLAERSGDASADLAAILRVDVALGVSARAALTGYFRAEHEDAGRWEPTLRALEAESVRLLAEGDGARRA